MQPIHQLLIQAVEDAPHEVRLAIFNNLFERFKDTVLPEREVDRRPPTFRELDRRLPSFKDDPPFSMVDTPAPLVERPGPQVQVMAHSHAGETLAPAPATRGAQNTELTPPLFKLVRAEFKEVTQPELASFMKLNGLLASDSIVAHLPKPIFQPSPVEGGIGIAMLIQPVTIWRTLFWLGRTDGNRNPYFTTDEAHAIRVHLSSVERTEDIPDWWFPVASPSPDSYRDQISLEIRDSRAGNPASRLRELRILNPGVREFALADTDFKGEIGMNDAGEFTVQDRATPVHPMHSPELAKLKGEDITVFKSQGKPMKMRTV